MNYPQLVNNAFELAKEAQKRAYAPYSKFHVGSAVKMIGDDQIYVGCNVENVSYGATICAERNALNTSVALSGKRKLEFLIVVCDKETPIPPCGLCLQHLSEFCVSESIIYLANTKEIFKSLTYKELLPFCFDSYE
ncbi:MAG: cytidine deaminase [Halobacteriovoraceae bacterium]|nr:cytidine deaminase [Halobacteriovoraceae bacterium]